MNPVEEIFGDAAAPYREAIEAARRFAKASGCPLGYSVIDWLNEKTSELDHALRKLHQMRKEST